MGFEGLPAERVAARDERKLMHGAVGTKNGPADAADPAVNLRKPLAAVEGLVVPARGMAEARVDFVETHEIKVVGSGEEEPAAGAGDAVHLDDSSLHLRQVLDCLAGDHGVKGVIGKRQALRIALDKRRQWNATG